MARISLKTKADSMDVTVSSERRKALKTTMGSSVFGPSALPEIQIVLVSSQERQINTFNRIVANSEYEISHNFENVDVLNFGSFIDNEFAKIVNPVLAKGQPQDFVSVTVSHQEMPKPLYVYGRVENFKVEEILNRMAECSQSNATFFANGLFNFEMSLTRRLSSSGRGMETKKRASRPMTELQKSRRSVVKITNSQVAGSENACGYWAIACAKYQADNQRMKASVGSSSRSAEAKSVEIKKNWIMLGQRFESTRKSI